MSRVAEVHSLIEDHQIAALEFQLDFSACEKLLRTPLLSAN